MKIKEMAIDPVKFEQGAWISGIPEMGELRLKVRGIGNSDYRKMQTRLIEAEPRQYKVGGRLTPERQDFVQSQCMLHTVLIDWDGLRDEHDAPIPYSVDLARDLLTKPEYRRFRDAVAWAASVVGDDVALDGEEAGKSLETPSAGT